MSKQRGNTKPELTNDAIWSQTDKVSVMGLRYYLYLDKSLHSPRFLLHIFENKSLTRSTTRSLCSELLRPYVRYICNRNIDLSLVKRKSELERPKDESLQEKY